MTWLCNQHLLKGRYPPTSAPQLLSLISWYWKYFWKKQPTQGWGCHWIHTCMARSCGWFWIFNCLCYIDMGWFFIKAKLLIRSLSNSVELWIVVCPCVDSFFMVKALRVHRVETCQMLPFQVSDFFPTLISFCVKDFKQKIGAVNPVDCCWVDFFMMFLHAGSS